MYFDSEENMLHIHEMCMNIHAVMKTFYLIIPIQSLALLHWLIIFIFIFIFMDHKKIGGIGNDKMLAVVL